MEVKKQYIKNSKITSTNINVNEFYDHSKTLFGSEPNATTDNNEIKDTIHKEYSCK